MKKALIMKYQSFKPNQYQQYVISTFWKTISNNKSDTVL